MSTHKVLSPFLVNLWVLIRLDLKLALESLFNLALLKVSVSGLRSVTVMLFYGFGFFRNREEFVLIKMGGTVILR